MNKQTPTWQCPVCSKTIFFEDLVLDKYFEDILDTAEPNVESVVILPDGNWMVGSAASDSASEISDGNLDQQSIEPSRLHSGSKTIHQLGLRENSVRSPSIARPQKRTAEVVDLTLSDEDDNVHAHPPRKRSVASLPPPQLDGEPQQNGHCDSLILPHHDISRTFDSLLA